MNKIYTLYKPIILIFIIMLFTASVLAQNHQHHQHSEVIENESSKPQPNNAADCQQLVQAKVNGLVCDFCARALEKVFGKRVEVAGIAVDLDAGHVNIEFNSGQTIAEAELKQMIEDSGYHVVLITQACEQ